MADGDVIVDDNLDDEAAAAAAAEETSLELNLEDDKPELDDQGNPIKAEELDGDDDLDDEAKAAKAKADEEAAKKAKEIDGEPEAYSDFTFPEGYEQDESLISEFSPLAKEAGLSQEMAQKFVDLQVKSLQSVTDPAFIADSVLAAQDDIVKAQKEQWQADLKADETLGGSNLSDTMTHANQALTQFGDADLRASLKDSGWSSNPNFIRMLSKIGKAVSEDSFGGAPSGGENQNKTAADTLYPDANKS